MSQDEQLLIRQVRDGQAAAFEEIFNRYHAALHRFAWHLTRSPEAAADVLQTVFLKIWRNRRDWQPKGSLSAYLFRATKNAALNYLRQPGSRDGRLQTLADSDELSVSPEKIYDDEETLRAIRAAVDSLPEGCRTVFILSRYENKKYNEIAAILEISVKTVENQMGRALRLLRDKLVPIFEHQK
jgi:RNA polymerase sigma-70 factor (ECF subfamily)